MLCFVHLLCDVSHMTDQWTVYKEIGNSSILGRMRSPIILFEVLHQRLISSNIVYHKEVAHT